MCRRLNIQLIKWAFLTLSVVSSEQVLEPPVQLHEPQPAPSDTLLYPLPPPPHTATIFEQPKFEDSGTSLPSNDQFVERPQFIKLLLERLDKPKTYDNDSLPASDYLSLTLKDGSFNTVTLEFKPNIGEPEDEEAWGSIVNLLADTFAQVVQKAEQKGYITLFKHSISIELSKPVAYAPGLSVNALKSSVG